MNVPRAANTAPESPATRKPINATVITTGPGVIIATATASRNCWSFSQPYSFTTPLYRNGRMARPLPNTNAPAFVKNHVSCHRRLTPAVEIAGELVSKGIAPSIGATAAFNRFGGPLTNQVITPAKRNSAIHSDSVTTVAATHIR